MKIKKLTGPPTKLLGDLKNGDLFERADVQQPCTTYMVVKSDRSIKNVESILNSDCTFVVDLANAVFKALPDDCETVPLEQDNEIVVREL